MSGRPSCCCPVCELEQALLYELKTEKAECDYQDLASQSSTLSAFPTGTDLLLHLRAAERTSDQAFRADGILGELLRMSRNQQHEVGRQLVLLLLMPAIHRTSSQITNGFPSLSRDDIVQHVVTSVLEILQSPTLPAQKSYFFFTIIRAMRRSAYRWALHEADFTAASTIEETVLNEFPPDAEDNFETHLVLTEFLARCLSCGVLSSSDHDLLVLFKIHGVSSEILAARQKISDVAFRHRMQRVIEKLRRAARARSTSRQHTDNAVA